MVEGGLKGAASFLDKKRKMVSTANSIRKKLDKHSQKGNTFVGRLWRLKNLEELLLTFSNAVAVHQKYYYDAGPGILYRSISPNNVIIRHPSQETDEKAAELIDYDHANIAECLKSWSEMQSWEKPKHLSRRATGVQLYLGFNDVFLSLAAVKSCIKVAGPNKTADYLYNMFERFPSRYPPNEDDREMVLKDLGLEEPCPSLPYFSTEAGSGQLTGTIAYISHRILRRDYVLHVPSAIDDMESLFWILIEYALIYEGPGGLEAKLTPESLTSLKIYFDTGYYSRKSNIFYYPARFPDASNRFKEEIVSHIQNYFKPLQTSIEEWWKTLFTAYEFKGFEFVNIHFHIAAILQKAVEEIRAMNLPIHEYMIEEDTAGEVESLHIG